MTDDRQNQIDEHARERAGQDFDDLNNEVAGRHHGRIKRFTGEDSLKPASTKVSRDYDLILEVAAQQQLTATQQKDLQQLNQRLDEYDRATDKALAEIDRELAQAREEYQRIQENATVLSDGRRVYRDEDTGLFYDENDQEISEEAQIEAREAHENGDSARETRLSVVDRIATAEEKQHQLIEFNKQKEDIARRMEQNPGDAAEAQRELENAAPEIVRRNLDSHTTDTAHNYRKNEAGTSVAKSIDNNGIDAAIALAPTFQRAGATEQPSPNSAQPEAPNESAPKQDTGIGLG